MAQTEGLTRQKEGEGDFKVFRSGTKVMVNGDVVFTFNTPIQITTILSECVTANNATASTMQWNFTPTVGDAATISAASASLANFAAGGTVILNPTSLATAPTLAAKTAGGVQVGANVANLIVVPAGVISLVIGVGSTTGTWRHTIHYLPLGTNTVMN